MSEEQRKVPVLNAPSKHPISDKRRDLMFRAMDGDYELSGVMFILHHYKFCDEILSWLIFHKHTGKNLRDWLVKAFRGNVPSLVDYVVSTANATVKSNVRENT